MKKWIGSLAVVVIVISGGILASADTLQLEEAPYGVAGPYQFSVNGSTTMTPLICYSDYNLVGFGEQWTVQEYTIANVANITGDFAGTTAQYNELGYLANELFSNPGNNDIQNAIWAVLNKGGAQNSYYTDALNHSNDTTSDVFYIPVSDAVGGPVGDFSSLPYGEPQPFIGRTAVPEPSSFLLLGTGVLGLAGTLKRKLRR